MLMLCFTGGGKRMFIQLKKMRPDFVTIKLKIPNNHERKTRDIQLQILDLPGALESFVGLPQCRHWSLHQHQSDDAILE